MKENEVKQQMARITQFRALERQRDEIYAALKKVTEDWKEGPHGQGPFTGNTRESRQVNSMHIRFSMTRGGADSVEIDIQGMHIEACELGQCLSRMLQAKIDELNAAMEKL